MFVCSAAACNDQASLACIQCHLGWCKSYLYPFNRCLKCRLPHVNILDYSRAAPLMPIVKQSAINYDYGDAFNKLLNSYQPTWGAQPTDGRLHRFDEKDQFTLLCCIHCDRYFKGFNTYLDHMRLHDA